MTLQFYVYLDLYERYIFIMNLKYLSAVYSLNYRFNFLEFLFCMLIYLFIGYSLCEYNNYILLVIV